MSNITLDTIRSLDANKSYYLANSTGLIKEAGAWQKFKCFFGFGDSREKVQRLVDQVKIALLEASKETDNAALSADIEKYEDDHNWSFSASGRSLAEIAKRFSAANAGKIASASAGEIAEKRIHAAIKDSIRPCLRREDWPADAERYLQRAAKPLVDHPPVKNTADGRSVLDEAAFEKQLRDLLDGASNDLVHIANSERLGMPRFDDAYLDHVFATFYDENGVRNGKTADDLKSAFDVRLERAREEAPLPVDADEASFDALRRTAIEACGKDVDALNRVLQGTRRILVTDGGQVRSPEEVRKFVAGICASLAELREAAKGNAGVLRVGLDSLGGQRGKPLPRGMVAKIAELARSADIGLVAKLGPGSTGFEIHKAIMQLYAVFHKVLYDIKLVASADGQDDLAPARPLAYGFLLGRLPPGVLRNIEAALESPAASRLHQAYYDLAAHPDGLPEGVGDVPEGVCSMIFGRGGSLNYAVTSIKETMDMLLGLPHTLIDPAKGERLSYESVGGNKIFFDIREDVERIAKEERRDFLANKAVKGDGPAAATVRELFSAQLDEAPFKVAENFKIRFTDCVRPFHSLATLSDAKKVEKGLLKDTGFAKAIADGTLEVELKGAGKLSADPGEALEQLARYVSGRDDATFATLDASARRKVAVIAGALGDKAMKSISGGVALALDPAGGKEAFAISGGTEKRRVTVDVRGVLPFDMKIEIERTGASLRTGNKSFVLNPGSSIKSSYEFTINSLGMQRLEEVDLDAFDGSAAEEIASSRENIPDRAGRVKEILGRKHMLGSGGNSVKAGFVIT